jgi:hypothetical protein
MGLRGVGIPPLENQTQLSCRTLARRLPSGESKMIIDARHLFRRPRDTAAFALSESLARLRRATLTAEEGAGFAEAVARRIAIQVEGKVVEMNVRIDGGCK